MPRDGKFETALREAFMAGAEAGASGSIEREIYEEDYQQWRSTHFSTEGAAQ
jgi:hypothetical protein